MFTMMKASEFAGALASTLKSAVKIALQSRRTRRPDAAPQGHGIVVLANGPSLRQTIVENSAVLAAMPTLAVNFMANSPEMALLKPCYYVLADPFFFEGIDHDNVKALWRNLASVSWPMTLFVPARRLAAARRLLGDCGVEFATFNFVGAEGFGWFERLAYGRGLAMPRPRNVLIPAIMAAIASGYKEIYITGADHSWMETLRVDDENHTVSVQPHFYKDSEAEKTRSVTEYRGYHLHDIIYSFYVAFRSYHRLERFAAGAGIDIFNSTPGSYIDAFRRRPLPGEETLEKRQ